MTAVDAKTLAPATEAAKIAEAVRHKVLVERRYTGKKDLDDLSSRTEVDDVDVYEKQISFDGRNFSGLCELSVTMNFDDDEDLDWRTEVFPGHFSGRLEEGRVIVDDVEVDTATFYE